MLLQRQQSIRWSQDLFEASWLDVLEQRRGRRQLPGYHVGRGRYRVWVAAVKGLLDNYVYVATR